MPKLHTIEAKVHQGAKVANGYRVKVSVLDLGLYINGMMVYPPKETENEWNVYTPAQKVGSRFVRIVEFDKKLPLWQEIYDACVEAAQLEHSLEKDVVLKDIPDGPINLDSIPL